MPLCATRASSTTLGALLLFLCFFVRTAAAEDPSELVFVFQKQKDPSQVQQAADEVATFLSEQLAMPVRAKVPSDYSASVQALVSKKADIAYTSSLPFLLARRDGGAEVLLVEQREDLNGKARTDYDSVFVVPKDSQLQSIDDLKSKAKDLRVVFTSPTSTSGYVFAYLRLVREGLLQPKQDPKTVFGSVGFGGSYTKALEEVLAGRADVAAVSYYAVEGPTVGSYLKPEQAAQLRVLARTSGVPTHLISAREGLSDGLKARIKNALLALSAERPTLLEDVYGTAKFVEVDEEEHLKGTVEAVEFLGLPIERLAG
ncbi:MAG: phosphate/phosphite/phosphonate ABC transporter substrate-binding protein [Bdellovibrionales bacterium]|nr:phosphate/phosphite/phosphonate ABC transporter substrate-binding protein [Bdellovibrionales bacterium]